MARLAPRGVMLVPVRGLSSGGLANDSGVILLDAETPNKTRTIRHEIFHFLAKQPGARALVRRVLEAIDSASVAFRQYRAERNAWNQARGLPPLTVDQAREEIAADLYADWNQPFWDGSLPRLLNAAVASTERESVREALAQLGRGNQGDLAATDAWGIMAGPGDLFDVPAGPSKIETELRRIAETRGARPAPIGDFEAIAEKSLQSKARRLADDVREGRKTEAEAKAEWEKAQADIERERQRQARRREALRTEAAERAQMKLIDVPTTGGMLFEEQGEYHVTDQHIETFLDRQQVPADARPRAREELRQWNRISREQGTPYLAGAEDWDQQSGSVPGAPGASQKRQARHDHGIGRTEARIAREGQAREAARQAWRNPTRENWERAFALNGKTVSTVVPALMAQKIPAVDVRGMMVRSPEEAAGILWMIKTPLVESFKVLAMDRFGAVLEARIVSTGLLDASLVHPREVFRNLPEGTAQIVIGHNHPSGVVDPSVEDVRLTRQLIKAGEILGITVTDHVITNGTYRSLRETDAVEFKNSVPVVAGSLPRKQRREAPRLPAMAAGYQREPWEIIDRTHRIPIKSETAAFEFYQRLSNRMQDGQRNIILLDTRNQVVAILRMPETADALHTFRAAAREFGEHGVGSFIVEVQDTPEGVGFAQEIEKYGAVYGVALLDAVAWGKNDSTPYRSLLAHGLIRGKKDASDLYGVKEGGESLVARSANIVREGGGRYGDDPLTKVARVLVGMHGGAVPTRAQAEAFLRARGWWERLAGRLDEILQRADSIARNKELDYAIGINTGTLGSEGESGRQAIRAESPDDAAGHEQAVPGATGGAGPRRRRDIRIAGARDLPRPPDYVAPDADADEDQRLGVNLAIHRFVQGGRGFLLADGTGVGKTTQILLTAKIWRERNPGTPILIVTQNEATIKGSFYEDARRMGIALKDFHLATYSSLKSGKIITGLARNGRGAVTANKEALDEGRAYELVIFDEAHNLKNLDAQKTVTAYKFLSRANHVVYATATPMDSPVGAVYFMSQITGMEPERIGDLLGFTWKTVKKADGSTISQAVPKQGMDWKKVLANLANMRNEAVRQGAMVRREYPFLGEFSTTNAEVDPDGLEFEQRIIAYFMGVAERYPPGSAARKRWKGQVTFAAKHWAVSLKIKDTLRLVRESLAAGRVPIVVSEYVEPSNRLHAPEEFVERNGKVVPNWRYDVWMKTIGENRTIPGVLGEISKALTAEGITHAKIYGEGDKSIPVAAFQGGRVRAALMTPQSGGTGVNLDDVVGDKPRDMIIMSPVFAGDLFQQVIGRVSRRNTASPSRVIYVAAPGTYGDDKARAILKKKIDILTRVQQGEDIDLATFDPEIGVVVNPGREEAAEDEGGEEVLADMGSGTRAGMTGADEFLGEDVSGLTGGVWEPRLAEGLPEPTTGRAVMNLPALVRLYRMLMGGRVPEVKPKMRMMGGNALGAFYPGTGKIQLLATIFDPVPDSRKGELARQAMTELGASLADPRVAARYRELLKAEYAKPESQEPRQALATLAHEIGHAYDWLPDRNMAKGNVLGRIAAIRDYARDMLGAMPQFQDLIDDAERVRMRAEAAKQARAMIPPAGRNASEAERKARDEAVSKLTSELYAKALAAEARRRNLITRETVMGELKALTQWWKPFDDLLDIDFTEYRYSAPELIADAMSVLMNRPDALRRIAPTFEKALFAWMEKRPEFLRAWDRIQAELLGGEADSRLVEDILAGFHEAEDKERENLAKRDTGWKTLTTALRFAVIDTADPILRKVREYGERELDALQNPRYAIEDALYAGSAHEAYLKRVERDVLSGLREAALTPDALGLYALARRVADERFDKANPYGVDPAAARRILDRFTPEQRRALDKAWDKFWALRKELVLDDIEATGAWSDELMAKAGDNEAYATFDVVEYMRSRYGSAVGPRVYRQVGTLKGIKNPFTATIQKDLSLISATLRNTARRKVVEFLQMAFPGEVQEAKTRWNGQFQEAVAPDDPNQDLLGYMDKGKFKGFYVDKWVAAHFAHEDPAWLRALGGALSAAMRPFRFAFTDANAGFWAMNAWRDYHAAIAHLPGAWSPIGTYTWHWAKGVREGFKSVFGTPSDVVQEMLQKKMLISMVSRSQEATGEDTILDRLLVQVQPKRLEWNALAKPAEMVSAALDWWTGIGKSLERANQIAAYTWLKAHHPAMSEAERAHLVRTVASPAFLRKGSAYLIYNNLFMFSNAAKEGMRAEAEAMRRGKAAWAIKTVAYVLLPRMVTFALRKGWIPLAVVAFRNWMRAGDDEPEKTPDEVTLQKMYGLIPEYDLANYLCAPVGIDPQDRVVYLRFPQMENARMIGGTFWKSLAAMDEGEIRNVAEDVFSFAGGQLPRLSPYISLPWNVGSMLSGENPVDAFTQRPMVPETVWDARDRRTLAAAGKALWNQAGGGILLRFSSDNPRTIQTELEKALGAPVLGNIAARFIKVSDRGLGEEEGEIKQQRKTEAARERLNVDEMAAGERPWDTDALRHQEYLKKLLIRRVLREARVDSRNSPETIRNLQILQEASGPDEREELIRMLERRGMLK